MCLYVVQISQALLVRLDIDIAAELTTSLSLSTGSDCCETGDFSTGISISYLNTMESFRVSFDGSSIQSYSCQ